MPNGGNINIGLQPSANAQFATATATIDGGSYDGRTAGVYTAAAGTTVTNGNGMTCANYCHGYGTPTWTSTTGTVLCGSCHGQTTGGLRRQPRRRPRRQRLSRFQGGQGPLRRPLRLQGRQARQPPRPQHRRHRRSLQAVPRRLRLRHRRPSRRHRRGQAQCRRRCRRDLHPRQCHHPGHLFQPGLPRHAQWDSAAHRRLHLVPRLSADQQHRPCAAGSQPVNHDTCSADSGAGVTANHDDCTYCHGYKDNGTDTLTAADRGPDHRHERRSHRRRHPGQLPPGRQGHHERRRQRQRQ